MLVQMHHIEAFKLTTREWQRIKSGKKDLDTFKARIRDPPHPLVSSRLFSNRCFFILDVMHLLYANGVAGHVYGGVLAFILVDARVGGIDRSAWMW